MVALSRSGRCFLYRFSGDTVHQEKSFTGAVLPLEFSKESKKERLTSVAAGEHHLIALVNN